MKCRLTTVSLGIMFLSIHIINTVVSGANVVFGGTAGSNAGYLPGQIIVDPQNPAWLAYNRDADHDGRLDPFFMCGPGGPEGFLYGDIGGGLSQDAVLDQIIAHGGNCIYMIAVRSHGGDGTPDQNPFIDHDPAKGLDTKVLDGWEKWFERMEQHGVVIYFFFYDDGVNLWKGDGISSEERSFIRGIVDRFKHHPNLMWCIAEEYSQALSKEKIRKLAAEIHAADDHSHIIAVHQKTGKVFDFPDDENLDQFAMQIAASSAAEVHAQCIESANRARGRFNAVMAELNPYHSDLLVKCDRTGVRRACWAAAMASHTVMHLGTWEKAAPTVEMLEDYRRLSRFFESIPCLTGMEPRDDKVRSGSAWVLARRGQYLVYLPEGGEVTLDLSDSDGMLRVDWYNPREGTTTSAGSIKAGGLRSFKFPDQEDWALHLKPSGQSKPTGRMMVPQKAVEAISEPVRSTDRKEFQQSRSLRQHLLEAVTEDIAEARNREFAKSKGGPENNKLRNFSADMAQAADTAAKANTDAKTVSERFARGGKTAFQHRVNQKGERSELAMMKTEIGGTYWYGWSMLLPKDFDHTGSKTIVMQLAAYPTPRNGKFPCKTSGPFMHVSTDGRLVFHLQHKGDDQDMVCDEFTVAEDVSKLKGKWLDFVMHAKWTGNEDGFLQFWVKVDDNNYFQKVDYQGRTWWNDEDKGPYFKMGAYMGDPGWQGPPERTIYTDEYRLGNLNSSFDDVAPPGAEARALEAGRGQIHYVLYPSALNKCQIPIMVYTPPGYDPNSAKRYPVVYNLHGSGGGSPARQWNRVQKTLTNLIDSSKIRPMIYVFVNGLGDTFYMDLPDSNGVKGYSSIVKELIPFIDSKYKTIASHSGRAIDGFSMGGCGSLMVAMKSPDLFSAVVSYGAAVIIRDNVKFPTKQNFKTREELNEFDVWALLPRNAAAIRSGLRIRMVCGDADGLFPVNVKFKDLLDSLNIPVSWVAVPGVKHDTKGLFDRTGLESMKFIEKAWDEASRNSLPPASVDDASSSGHRSFKPGQVWLDTEGHPIICQGGGFLFHEGTYYWYGEQKQNPAYETKGVVLYTSRDLYNWQYRGHVLPGLHQKGHKLEQFHYAERPKVIYNDTRKRFVMWVHLERDKYKGEMSGVAISKNAEGPFELVDNFNSNDALNKDMTVYKDEDGRAYHIYASEWSKIEPGRMNEHLHISLLNSDCLKDSGTYRRYTEERRREAPAVFKWCGKYYLVTSGCSGFRPNASSYSISDDLLGPWKVMGNPMSGNDAETSYHSQGTYILTVQGRKDAFIFVADRWNTSNFDDSRQIWLPIQLQPDGTIRIDWLDEWDLSFFDWKR